MDLPNCYPRPLPLFFDLQQILHPHNFSLRTNTTSMSSANYELLFSMACEKDNNNLRRLNFCLLFANYYLHYHKHRRTGTFGLGGRSIQCPKA